jgi:hypothetical protein
MRAFMRLSLMVLVLAASGLTASGCGKQIGDACIVASDCALDGSRVCDSAEDQGYCTIAGCDYSTCPGEAACIRFFDGSFSNLPCDPATENVSTNDCTEDELCTLDGECVPRSAESRYCMKKCDKDSDCRDHYECRTLALMKAHGGEPVLAPGQPIDDTAPKFCAMKPAAI